MNPPSHLRQLAKTILFGPGNFAQQHPIALSDPQQEVTVLLHGMSEPLDVTYSHVMACGAPFTIGVGLENAQSSVAKHSPLSLRFYSRGAGGKLLGSIALQPSAVIPAGNRQLHLFHSRGYQNFCLPKPWLWTRYLQYARARALSPPPDVRLTIRELHSMFVFYICPRPVVLGGVSDNAGSNVFPMNLMGPIGGGYFSFALNSSRNVTSLVERARRVALSSLPLETSPTVFQLGRNHRFEHIDLTSLPFSLKVSPAFSLPVPEFALRTREMQVEAVHKVGSHSLFIARTIHEERLAPGPEMFVVHGIYQAVRHKSRRAPHS
jgi:flavin reductase (DIM6/NTAB) family NADH-FMN oxidoreductase RutF